MHKTRRLISLLALLVMRLFSFDLLPAPRYGHCNFTTGEVLSAFDQLTNQRSDFPRRKN